MRRWFIFIIVSVTSLILFPAVAGCAQGYDATKHQSASRRVRGVRADAGYLYPMLSEYCNGIDDDGDGYADEDYECRIGQIGAECETDPGVKSHVQCRWPICTWNHFCCGSEVCGDGFDNDCDGFVDEQCY